MNTPRILQRAWRTLLVLTLALAFGGSLGSDALGQTEPKKDRITKPPARTQPARQSARSYVPPSRQPASQPAKEEPSPTTYPATQESKERFQKYQEMREAAQRNGRREDHPESQAAGAQSAPAGEPEPADPEERIRRMEEARRRAIESAQQRQTERETVVPPPEGLESLSTEQVRQLSPPYGTSQWQASTVPARELGKPGVVEPITAELQPEETSEPDDTPRVTREVVPPPTTTEVEEPDVIVTPIERGGREYFISFKATPWEDVIRYYQQLVGKPLMGEDMIPIGELTYESKRRFTRDELRDELNFLLLERNAFIVEREDYLNIVPTSEISKFITLDRVFPSIEAFNEADLRPLEICEVLIQVKNRPAKDLRDTLSPSMPDYAIPVVVGEANQIKITGLAQDVRRFMELSAILESEKFDPRETRFIKVETNVRDVETMLRQYLETQQPTRRYDREQRRFVTEGGDTKILIIPDERTKTLIVKATPAELREVEQFVKLIDEKPDIGDFKTHVLPIQYGNATEIARLLNEILRQEQGEQRRMSVQVPVMRQRAQQTDPRTGRITQQQTATPAPEDIIVEDLYERARKTVRIVADERTNNLVVYANADGLKRVREILEQIDVPVPTNFKSFTLKNARPSQIQPTIEQITRGVTGPGVRGAAAVTIIADDGLNALHVIADREEMTRIEKIIRDFDIEIPADEWHIVQLKNITASDAARKISPFLESGGTTGRRTGRPVRGGAAAAPAAATTQVIPLDASATLIVICSPEVWADVEKVLQIADEQALTDRPEIRFFEIQNGNPEAIAATVGQLYSNYQHPVLGRPRTFVDTLDNQVVVQAVIPALQEIESLIKTLDVKVEGQPLVILPLVNADAQDVLQQIQPLLPAGGARGGARPGMRATGVGGGNTVQADPITNSLIIQADPTTLERIKNYVTLYEQQVASQTPERKTYTLKFAAARDVMNAINSFFGAARGGRQARTARVTAVVVGSQVIVDAPADKQREVEALISELDTMSDQGVTTLLVKLPGADIRSIASHLTSAFVDRVRTQGVVARFDPDMTTETILMTCSKDVIEEAEELLNQYKELTSEWVWETEQYQLKHANANETAQWLSAQLNSLLSQSMSQTIVRQIRVTPDMRTNRIFINAPQLAVKQGLLLLDQYDTPVEQQPEPPMEIWTEKLPGLDVRNLAATLQRNLDQLMQGRTDRLRAVVTADQLTNNLIITAPTDMKAKVVELIAQFSAETEELEIVQEIIDVKNTDANYVASQLRNILSYTVGSKRGTGIAQQLNFQVDSRLNRVIMNAPKLVVDEALALAAELDKESDQERPLQTIPLLNADASTVNGVLQQIYSEKIRARTLQISIEPLSNSLIVSAAKTDFEDIKSWVEELDANAKDKICPPELIDFKNANPWEVLNVLNATFMQRSVGRRVLPGQEIKMSVVGGRGIVVQAPPDKLEEIKALAAMLDEVGAQKAEIRVYEMPGLGNNLTQFAQQIQAALNQQITGRENRPSVTAYPPADSMIVSATPQQFEMVEAAIEKLKPIMEVKKAKTEILKLQHVDASAIAGVVQNLVQTKLAATGGSQRGAQNFSVTPDNRTNRLIVFAPENIMPEVRDIVEQFDIPVTDDNVVTIVLKYADPWETRNMINDIFGGQTRRGGDALSEQVYVTVSNNTLIVKAPPKKLEMIHDLLEKIDVEDVSGLQIKTYQLKVLNATTVAVQVQMFLNSMGRVQRRGQMQPNAFAEPTTNTLVVIAPADKLPFIEGLITQIEALGQAEESSAEAYVLKNIRADQAQRHVDQMLKAKVAEMEGQTRGRNIQQTTAVMAEPETNRLFVFAPQKYQALAAEMIALLDQQIELGDVIRIIRLENADASSLAQTVTQTLQGSAGGRSATPLRVKVVPDAGSNSILLAGLPKDVADAEALIKDLEVTYDTIPELKYFTLDYAHGAEVADVLRSLFPTSRNPADNVTVTEDEYYTNKLLVTANHRKMRQVEAVIEKLDLPPEEQESFFGNGRDIYFVPLTRGKAGDIVYDLQDLLPPASKGGPSLDYDYFNEDYIQVICRPNEFDRILKLIRQFEKKAKPEIVVRARQFLKDPAALVQYLQDREYDFNLDVPEKTQERESIIIDLHPEKIREKELERAREKAKEQEENRRGKSAAVSWLDDLEPYLGVGKAPPLFGGVILTTLMPDLGLDDNQDPPPAATGKPEPTAPERRVGVAPRADTPPRTDIRPVGGDAESAPEGTNFQAEYYDDLKEPPQRQRATIQVLPDGRIIMRGPRDAVEELDDAIDLFEKDLSRGEVIRIFRFCCGDVNAASRILDMMFNDTRIRMPQQVQRPGQQQPGRPGQQPGQGRGEGEQQDPRQAAMQMVQEMMGQRGQAGDGSASGKGVRIATDASHNYIIVKCDESLLPDIIQLLTELDITPSEVDIEVIQLKNLDATETANNIKEILGKGGSQGSRRQQTPTPRAGANPQQQLMELIQQQMVSIGGEVSAKVESVEIVPNSITNSLLVSAPREMMKIITNVIQQLEALEGGDITVIGRYKLDHAKVDDILPLLQDIFSAAGGGGGRGAGPRGGGSSPAELGPVTLSGDPRDNTIIYVAQAKDVKTVEEQIFKLDFEGAVAEIEMYICKYGDAESIAGVVSEMFAVGATPSSPRRGGRLGGAATSGGGTNLELRITAESATNTILIYGPEDKRKLALEQIEKLDRQNRFEIREIPVQYAKPANVADTLLTIFGGSGGSALAGGGQAGRRGGARSQVAQTTGRIVVVPDDNSKKLLVRAPDETFAQMIELVAVLDTPSQNLQIKTYALKHADAAIVVDSVKAALTEFLQLQRTLGQNQADFDAFTAMPDTRTNRIVVVGSPDTFLFVENVIAAIDDEIPADREKQFQIYVLDRADAQVVADAINSFAGGDAASGGGSRPGGRRGGFSAGAGIGGSGLDVQAIPDASTNSVMVYGRPQDILRIEREVIDKLEDAIVMSRQFATIKVNEAVPTQLITYIQPFIDQAAGRTTTTGGGGRRSGSIEATPGPRLIGNDNNGTIVVYGSPRQIEEVRSLIERFDNKDITINQFEIIPIPWGQDPFSLAATVQDLVNSSEQEWADRSGRSPRLVSLSADQHSNAIIAFGDPSQTAIVKTVISQLQDIRPDKPVTRVIELVNLSSAEAEQLITDLQQSRPGGGSRSSSTPGSSSTTRRRTTTPRPSTPGGSSPAPSRRRSSGTRSWNWNPTYDAPRLSRLGPALDATSASALVAPAGAAAPLVGMTTLFPRLEATLILHITRAFIQDQPAQNPPKQTSKKPQEPKKQQAQSKQPQAGQTKTAQKPQQSAPTKGAQAQPSSQARPQQSQPPPRRQAGDDPRVQELLEQMRKEADQRKAEQAPRSAEAQPTPDLQPTTSTGQPVQSTSLETLSPAGPQNQQIPLSSVTGQLRGDVIATPIDSRRIIITGDENDVDFIIRMLQMMEQSTPQAIIEVFSLQNAKAATVGPAIEQVMTKIIQARGGGSDRIDQFSIVAEARSNSLIVAASETNMDMIEEMIEKLDVDTMSDTRSALVPLKHIRATEAATLLDQAIQKLNQIRDVPANAQPSIQAVERSNAIQIVGTPADIAEIERIIEGLDVELPPEDDFSSALVTIIELKNASATDLSETLTDLIEMEKLNRGGGRGGQTNMPLLRKLIMKTADGRELPPLDLDKPIAFFPERGKNALVIFSSEKNSESLKEIVALFDSLPLGNEVEVRTFNLKFANAEETAKLLQDMFDDSKKALKRATEGDSQSLERGIMPPIPPSLAGRGLPYNVLVTHDVRTNTVIVVGHKDSVLLAAGIVTELDVASTEFNLKAHVLQLRNVQAAQLRESLEDLLDKRLDALGGDKNQARDGAIMRTDDRSNSLIVIATPEVFGIVRELALKLDQADVYSIVDGQFRRLRYADAAKLAAILQEYFDKKRDANREVVEQGQKDVLTVFADVRCNGLLMTGTRDYLAEAHKLIDNLDQAFDPTVQFKVRPVLLNSAANIAQLLQDMIDKSRDQQNREMQGTPIHIAADPYSNNLLIAAAAEDMVLVDRWIDVLDRPAEPGRVVRIIPVARGKAQDVSKSAEDMFKTQARGADADLTVTYDETTNSVIAIGPPAVVRDIVSYLNDLNSVEGPGAIVRIFKLDQANAEDAGNLVRGILEGRGGSVGGGSRSTGGGSEEFNQVMLIFQREHPEIGMETLKAMRKEIVVIDDLRTNALVITAPPESMPMMASLIEAIDVPPAAANIRIFKLRNSDAEEMVNMLKELFEQRQTSGGAGTATDQIEYQMTLGDLVAGGRQQIAFTTDLRTNSVIAAGTPGYLDLVDELVLKLDSEPIEDRLTFVYQPGNNPAVAIQQAISEYNDAEQQRLNELSEQISASKRMEREITAIASEDTNRIVIDCDPRRESDVLNLLRELDQPPPQVMIQVLIVEVTMDNSLELGVEFAFQDLQYTKAGPNDTTTFDFVGGTDVGAAGTGLGGFTFTITGADFNFLIRTLQNEGNLNILSRPQIVAMDNQEARIEITNDVPYPAGTTTGIGGVISTNVQRKDVGIKLIVTPHINPDGFVRMEIEQEVSDITSSTVDIGQGLTSPIFFRRNAKTVVTVKDDETVVLGGLITTRDEIREQKIPILGDIPILGLMFSNRKNDIKRTELLVVLTPRVIRAPDEFRELSIRERDLTGKMPAKVLTDELMSGLRVSPEQLQPEVRRETISPKPRPKTKLEPQPETEPEPEPADDDYGPAPTRSATMSSREQDEDSYDVPASLGPADSAWSRRRLEYR